MDWFTVLLIFIFFVLPLIQRVARQSRQRQSPLPGEAEAEAEAEVGEWEEEAIPAEAREARAGARRAGRPVAAPTGGGWSEDWGTWPGEARGDGDPVESGRKAEPRPFKLRVERVAKPPAPTPPPPVPFTYDADVEVARPAAPRLPSRNIIPPPRPSRRLNIPLARLNNPAELRRAIVLSEVLDRPLSLRSPSADRLLTPTE